MNNNTLAIGSHQTANINTLTFADLHSSSPLYTLEDGLNDLLEVQLVDNTHNEGNIAYEQIETILRKLAGKL